jgi:transposase-like protein
MESKRYSEAFKVKVVSEIERGKFRIGEAARVYDITGGNTIYRWLRHYGKASLIQKTVVVQTKNESDKIRQLEKEKRELESALAKTQVKLLAMETLIDVAEAHYQIDIKKTVDRSRQPNPASRSNTSAISRAWRDRQSVWLQPSRVL